MFDIIPKRNGTAVVIFLVAGPTMATSNPRGRMRPPACYLDLLPGTGINHLEIATGPRRNQQAVGQRLVRKRFLQKAGRVDVAADGSCVVHRRAEGRYTATAFLNDSDVVLAADTKGRVDIVKLPAYCATNEPRPLGTVLGHNLGTTQEEWTVQGGCKLFSLSSGKAFVVGAASGECKVFATERASTWGDRRGLSVASLSESLAQSATTRQSYISKAWTCPGPTRKYARGSISLLRQLQLGGALVSSSNASLASLDENGSWSSEFASFRAEPSAAASWDFRETACSLLSVHLDVYRDCFSIMDYRMHQGPGCKSHHVIVDRNMNGEKHSGEDATAVCFASENVVATALKVQDDTSVGSSIKLWDIRMTRRGNAVSQVFMPCFPRDRVHEMDALESLRIGRDHASIQAERNELPCTEVIKLTSSRNGTVLATVRDSSGSNSVSHCVIDPATGCIGDVVHQAIPTTSYKSTYAVDSAHENLACFASDGDKSVTLHKLRLDCQGTAHRRKRDHTGSPSSGTSPIQLSTKLCDGYGLETTLSCLAFNDSSTSLVGGSQDGDLFVWRV